MSRSRKFTEAEFMLALEGCRGVKSWLALRLGVCRSTINRYLDWYPEAKKLFDQKREEYLDELELIAAEMALVDHNPKMVMFLLRTLGKTRGYTEKMNINAKHDHSGYLVLTREEEIALLGKDNVEENLQGAQLRTEPENLSNTPSLLLGNEDLLQKREKQRLDTE